MPRWSGLIGALILGGGLLGASLENSNHHECSTGLGQFGQALSQDVARHCGIDNTVFFVGVLAAILGVFMIAAAVLLRS